MGTPLPAVDEVPAEQGSWRASKIRRGMLWNSKSHGCHVRFMWAGRAAFSAEVVLAQRQEAPHQGPAPRCPYPAWALTTLMVANQCPP